MEAIHFFNEEVDYALKDPDSIRNWITQVIAAENRKVHELNFIFCSDQYLHNLNTTYLKHDTFTDILTFDHSESGDAISGDIYLSVDRITENSQLHHTTFLQELFRVMIHGVLHLLGYDDKKEADKQEMRIKEEACLSLLSF